MSKKKGQSHANKKKLTTKERKAQNHLKLIQGKGGENPIPYQTENTTDRKKAA